MGKLNAKAFALAAGILAAAGMLLLGILGNLGIYETAVEAMANWHLYFSLSIGGIIAGMIEGFIWTFVWCYLFVMLYNKLLEKK